MHEGIFRIRNKELRSAAHMLHIVLHARKILVSTKDPGGLHYVA